MKARLVTVALACSVFVFGDVYAQPSGGKSGQRKGSGQKEAVDPALDEFFKAFNEPNGKFDQARFQKVISLGFVFVHKNPTHPRIGDVVRALPGFAGSVMRDKAVVPMRPVYISQLRYEIINQRGKATSDEARTAIAAIDVATADYEAGAAASRDGLVTLREKIDALTPMPGASRFLVHAERSYADLLVRAGRKNLAEAHLTKLLEHPDKDVVAFARTDLNFLQVSKEPFAAKFTGIDGKECDFAQLRGKVVAVVYFQSSDNAARYFEQLKAFQNEHKKKGFEVVTVSYDGDGDREKLTKWVKEKKVTWPVYFDGKAAAGDFAPKLGVERAPSVVIFDAKGILYATNLRLDQLQPVARQLLGVKEPVKEAPQEPQGGGGGGGGGNRRR